MHEVAYMAESGACDRGIYEKSELQKQKKRVAKTKRRLLSATGIEPVTLRYPCISTMITLQSDALPIELR